MDNNTEQQQPEAVELESKLVPKEIAGLDEFITLESIGGNAGPGRAGARALFLNTPEQEFLFTNSASVNREHGRDNSDIIFGVKGADAKRMMELIKSGQETPPFIIDEIAVKNKFGEENLEVITRRAREHNAQRVLDYYLKHGNMDDLPSSQYSPTNDEIRQLTIGVAIPAKVA